MLEIVDKAITDMEAKNWEVLTDILIHKPNALANLGRLEEAEKILKELYRKQKAASEDITYVTTLGFLYDFYWRFGLEKKALKVQRKILRHPNIPPLNSSKVIINQQQ